MITTISTLPRPKDHVYTVVDVRDSKSVNAWIESTMNKLGKLDGAVNMAGVITAGCPLKDEMDENFSLTFDINARGVFYCLRAQLQNMKAGASIVRCLQSKTSFIIRDLTFV